MARILRGDIVWADLNPVRGREQAGRRPVVVISHDIFNERSGTVITLAITSQAQRAGFPLALELKSTGLPKQSWVKISQIRTLSVKRLGKKIAHLSPEELDQLIEGLDEIIFTNGPCRREKDTTDIRSCSHNIGDETNCIRWAKEV